jgi:hypothetical protein
VRSSVSFTVSHVFISIPQCHCCSVGTQNTIGISPPDSALLYVICSPVGPYYPDGFKPVALHGTTEYVRAYSGGPFRKMDRVMHTFGLWLTVVRYQAREHIRLVPTTRLQSSHKSRRPRRVTSRISGYRDPNIVSLRFVYPPPPRRVCFCGIEAVDNRSAR